MSNLLNSGQVGIGEKTEEQVLETWSNISLLDGIDEEIKLKTAMLYEKAANILINMSNHYTYDSRISTLIFPIIRRVVSEIYKKVNEDRRMGMVYLLDAEYILKRTSAMFDDAISFYEKHLTSSNMDIEAECTAWLCQLIAFEYIAKFKEKNIIDLGDGKYEAVFKTDFPEA